MPTDAVHHLPPLRDSVLELSMDCPMTVQNLREIIENRGRYCAWWRPGSTTFQRIAAATLVLACSLQLRGIEDPWALGQFAISLVLASIFWFPSLWFNWAARWSLARTKGRRYQFTVRLDDAGILTGWSAADLKSSPQRVHWPRITELKEDEGAMALGYDRGTSWIVVPAWMFRTDEDRSRFREFVSDHANLKLASTADIRGS